jgi:hypothetical protein
MYSFNLFFTPPPPPPAERRMVTIGADFSMSDQKENLAVKMVWLAVGLVMGARP